MDGTILVADDDRTIRTVLTQALTRAGCKVHATSSLVTLMRWVEEGKGDLVISDVMMPDGNGLEALPRIAELRPGLPVIVISAQNTIMTAIQAAEAEAFDYLPKPFDLPDLMKRAAKALEVKRRANPAPSNAKAPSETMKEDLPLVGRTPAMQTLYRPCGPGDEHRSSGFDHGRKRYGEILDCPRHPRFLRPAHFAVCGGVRRRSGDDGRAGNGDFARQKTALSCLMRSAIWMRMRRPGSCGCSTALRTTHRASWPRLRRT